MTYTNLPAPEAVLEAAARVRETGCPQADDFAAQHVLASPSESVVLEAFTHASFP